MKFEAGYLVGMAMQSIAEPRRVADEIFSLGFARNTLWQILGLMIVSHAFVTIFVPLIAPAPENAENLVMFPPLGLALVEASTYVIGVFAIYWVGRSMGGTGSFEQAIATVTWVTFVRLILAVPTIVLLLFSAASAFLMSLVSEVVSFWLLSHFVAEMHGFRSVGLTFVGILLSLFAFGMGLGIIVMMIGVSAGAMGAL